MLKYIKTLRHVSISTDHRQGVCLYLKVQTYSLKMICWDRNMSEFF